MPGRSWLWGAREPDEEDKESDDDVVVVVWDFPLREAGEEGSESPMLAKCSCPAAADQQTRIRYASVVAKSLTLIVWGRGEGGREERKILQSITYTFSCISIYKLDSPQKTIIIK